MPEPVAAIPPSPPVYGFIAAARAIDDGARWEQGFRFSPEACGGVSGRVAVERCGDTDAMDVGDQPAPAVGVPFALYASDACSSFGFEARDWTGRARRALAAKESFQLAAELWTGSLDLTVDVSGSPVSPRSLADPLADTVTSPATAVSPVLALGRLEAGLATCGEGGQGMIHVTPGLLVALVAAQVLRLSGTTWVTPNGNLVVPDAGYPGTGPNGEAAGATQWAYATDLIGYRLAPVEIIPDSLGDARKLGAAMAVPTNDITVYAMRLAAWQWNTCCHLAALVDLPVPLVGGTS